MEKSGDPFIDAVRENIRAMADKGFAVGGVVELASVPGTFWKIVGGESPFWSIKYFAGPPIPAKDYGACFNETTFHTDWRTRTHEMVIETILLKANAMEVLATVHAETDDTLS